MQTAPDVAADLARRRTWAEVDLDAIAHNVRALRALLPATCRFMAVVKADGYGHGMTEVARAAIDAGATWLGVATLHEGLALRTAGFREPVLILGAVSPEDLMATVLPRPPLSIAITSPEILEALIATPASGFRVHLKIDTGMTRLGLRPDDAAQTLDLLARLRNRMALEGCFTHLATADDPESPLAAEQLAAFAPVAAMVRERFPSALVHAANSAGTIAWPGAHYDLVRVGIAMYGMYPAPILRTLMDEPLRPAMRLHSRVVRTLRVPAGTPVGYGATYRTERPTVIATVACGYADGYPRQASNRGEAVIGGRRHPVAGRVAMDYLMLDAGDADVRVGDEVELFGESVSADEVAKWAETISYHVFCGIGPRVPRLYLRGGQVVDVAGPR
ncbi:MAG TPA: alanine racemase [bacterium]|nr:alanine racemase [bacterium]